MVDGTWAKDQINRLESWAQQVVNKALAIGVNNGSRRAISSRRKSSHSFIHVTNGFQGLLDMGMQA